MNIDTMNLDFLGLQGIHMNSKQITNNSASSNEEIPVYEKNPVQLNFLNNTGEFNEKKSKFKL